MAVLKGCMCHLYRSAIDQQARALQKLRGQSPDDDSADLHRYPPRHDDVKGGGCIGTKPSEGGTVGHVFHFVPSRNWEALAECEAVSRRLRAQTRRDADL